MVERLLSIVTVTYNAETAVEKTIKSLLSQYGLEWRQIEMIFIDGYSRDSTVTVIDKYKSILQEKGASVVIVSEPDSGIYDAMNKGIKIATGKWLYMLNAGDLLYDDDVLAKMLLYAANTSADILYGDYCRVNKYHEDIMKTKPLKEIESGNIFCHQAIFARRILFENKQYDTGYKLTADYEWLLNAYVEHAKFEYIPICVVKYDLTGLSAKKMVAVYKEIHQIRLQYHMISCYSDWARYYAGLLKRWVLSIMWQRLRWKIYSILKENDLRRSQADE